MLLMGRKGRLKSNWWKVLFAPEFKSSFIPYSGPAPGLGISQAKRAASSPGCSLAAWSGHCPSGQYTGRLPVRVCWTPPALQDANHWGSLLIAHQAPPAPEWAQTPTGQRDAAPFLKEGELLEGMLAL